MVKLGLTPHYGEYNPYFKVILGLNKSQNLSALWYDEGIPTAAVNGCLGLNPRHCMVPSVALVLLGVLQCQV